VGADGLHDQVRPAKWASQLWFFSPRSEFLSDSKLSIANFSSAITN
jgi:hypothetical protein